MMVMLYPQIQQVIMKTKRDVLTLEDFHQYLKDIQYNVSKKQRLSP